MRSFFLSWFYLFFSVFSFAADVPTTPPTFTAPMGGGQSNTPTFAWSAVDGATKFDLRLNDLTLDNAQVIRNQNITGTSYTLTTPISDNHSFHAWVRAGNTAGWGPWSPALIFATGTAPTAPPVSAPTVSAPTGTNNVPAPTIEWSAVGGATRYDLRLDNLSTNTLQIIRESDLSAISFVVTESLVDGDVYRVYVRAGNAVGYGPWSPAHTFGVGSAPSTPPSEVPVVTAPQGTNHPVTPTITWTSVPLANRYSLLVYDQTAGNTLVINQTLLSNASFTVTTPLVEGHVYRARVRAGNEYGYSGWSAYLYFGVGDAPALPPSTVPAITAPTETGNSTTPLITWTNVQDGRKFDLQVDNISTATNQVIREPALTTNSYQVASAFTSGHVYRVRVRAGNELGFGAWSPYQTFGIGDAPIAPPATAPTITAPIGTGHPDLPLITWTEVATASKFDLQVDNLSTATNQVIRQTAVPTTSYQVTSPLTVDQVYRVRVRAGNVLGFGPWSTFQNFGVGTAPTAPPANAPTVTAPTGNENSTTPTIVWSPVASANKFDVRVDDLSTGTLQIIRLVVSNSTQYAVTTPLALGHTYRVYVRAGNEYGYSALSVAHTFAVASVLNQPPVVNAGQDVAVQLPNLAALSGTASDDNLPNPPAALTFTWSKLSGPGTVTFGTANALQTSAAFSQAGAYVLRLSATDSALSSSDDVDVVVTAAPAGLPNDHFANAIVLAGAYPVTTGTNVEATIEPGEPNHAGSLPEKTVWWRWTAPTAGNVSITTAGSNFNTVLAVYTGNAVGTLSLVAENDNALDLYFLSTSRVVIEAQQGETYQIAVGGAYSDEGSIHLAIGLPAPANDNFADAILISGNSASLTAYNEGATKEPGEPNHAGFYGDTSLWWKWVAPASGRFELDVSGSDFGALLGVYTGGSVDALNEITSVYYQATSFDAVAGTTYYFAVDGIRYFYTHVGRVSLELRPFVAPIVSIESTDNQASEDGRDEAFVTIRRVGGPTTQIPIAITFGGSAAIETDYDVAGGEGEPPVFYLTGETLTLPIKARDDAEVEGAETIVVQIESSSAYAIQGNPQVEITIQDVAPPINDQFANATALNIGVNNSHNIGATIEPNEPGSGESSRSVWWKWTATKNGPVAVNVVTDFSITAAVYTGVSIDQLTLDKLILGPTSFIAVQGQEYRIRVAGGGNTYGNIQLVFTLDDPNPVQVAINYPAASSTVSGSLSVIGQAIDTDGGTFQLEYYNQQEFNLATGVVATGSLSIQNGELGIWNTSLLPPGIYELKLTARDVFGFTAEIVRTVNIGTSVAASTAKSSPLSTASPFDEAQFLNNTDWRTEYLATLEPSRVWQSAAPGAGVVQLKSQGSTRKVSAAGSTVTLTVVGAPNWPVTFCCMNKGRFVQNTRNVITVVADAQGVATVTVEVEKGRNTVLAASPKSSGQIVFLLQDQ